MYNGYITRLKNVRKHSNADRLQIATCFGNNVVVGLDAYEGELVCYFPTDGQLSEEQEQVQVRLPAHPPGHCRKGGADQPLSETQDGRVRRAEDGD